MSWLGRASGLVGLDTMVDEGLLRRWAALRREGDWSRTVVKSTGVFQSIEILGVQYDASRRVAVMCRLRMWPLEPRRGVPSGETVGVIL